jgi:hypothetical protein
MNYKEIIINILTKSFVPVPNSTGFMLDNQNIITEVRQLNMKKEDVLTLLDFMSKVAGVVMLSDHQNLDNLIFDIKRVSNDII